MFVLKSAIRRHRATSASGPRDAARRHFRLAIDRLEGRQLLAGSLMTSSVPISPAPVEGSAFTAVVAQFHDADPNTDATKYSAMIDWGNGHVTAGTVVPDPDNKAGDFDVQGTNTYAHDGPFAVSVSIRDQDGDTGTARTTNVVADAPLTATGVNVSTTLGQALRNVTVATFTDTNPNGKASDFAATIDWGDGKSSTGTIVANRQGGFDVKGTHTYASAGAFAIHVQIRDGGPGVVSTQFYTTSNLISDGAVPADHIDPNLVNPWGIVASSRLEWWINTNGTGLSELVDGSGNPTPGLPFVTVPPPNGSSPGTTSTPTGIVVQDTRAHPNDFVISNGAGASAPSVFIFATEDGTISGWNPAVATNGSKPSNQAFLAVDDSASGAVFKGLTLLTVPAGTLLPQGNYLFATDFHNGQIDVFDSKFNPVTLPAGAFQDPTLPAGFAPFGIQSLPNGNLYVTYAKQDTDKHDDVAGPGNGFVDVYNPAGFFIQRLGGTAPQLELNSPWGIAMAPANFGKFSNDILVGNFGDSHVSAFDPVTGAFLGQISDAQGHPLVLNGGAQGTSTKGLWGLNFGNGFGSGPSNTLFFTAGINDEADGLFGGLTAASVATTTTSSTGAALPRTVRGGGAVNTSITPFLPSRPLQRFPMLDSRALRQAVMMLMARTRMG